MRFGAAIAGMSLLMAASSVQAAAPSAGVAEARRWAGLMDRGAYEQSWLEASEVFRQQTTKDAWVGTVGPIRDRFGAMSERNLIGEVDADTLSGVPGRGFKIVNFYSKFAGEPERVLESVVLMRDHGAWKVQDYYVK